MAAQLVMYEEEFHRINAVCDVDKNGQLISAAGQTHNIDTTSLASLTAGNVAAMGGLAKLIGEQEFPAQFYKGGHVSLHMELVGGRVVLVVVFENTRASQGLVQLRVKKASEELNKIFQALSLRAQQPGSGSPFAEISDADIDNLFSE